jgi:hypothetical protein
LKIAVGNSSTNVGQIQKISNPQNKICGLKSRFHNQKFSLKFKVKLLEIKLFRSMAITHGVFLLNLRLDPSSYTSNLRLIYWWNFLEAINH